MHAEVAFYGEVRKKTVIKMVVKLTGCDDMKSYESEKGSIRKLKYTYDWYKSYKEHVLDVKDYTQEMGRKFIRARDRLTQRQHKEGAKLY